MGIKEEVLRAFDMENGITYVALAQDVSYPRSADPLDIDLDTLVMKNVRYVKTSDLSPTGDFLSNFMWNVRKLYKQYADENLLVPEIILKQDKVVATYKVPITIESKK